jgi:hypothetical protein
LNIGALTDEQLVFRAGVSCESVVGLDDCTGRVAGIQVPIGVARRGRQDTGKLLDRTTIQTGYTHNIATRDEREVSRLQGIAGNNQKDKMN